MEVTLDYYLDKLASTEPAPGGGGASALVGAIGVALGCMVCNLSIGKKKYEEYENINTEVCNKLQSKINAFGLLSKNDAEVLMPLINAYKLPANTEEEKKHKEVVMEGLLENAANVPIKVMEEAIETIELIGDIGNTTTKLAKSDLGVAASTIESCLRSSILNVYINTKGLKNREKAILINQKAEKLLDYGIEKCTYIYNDIKNQIKN